MPFVNPYGPLLEGRDPRDVMDASIADLSRLVSGWPASRYDASYAPGKWTARQILLHLAQVEMIDGVRLRMALSEPDYVVQPFTPDGGSTPRNRAPVRMCSPSFMRCGG